MIDKQNEIIMNYKRFDRHENMSSDTVSEILNITSDLMFFEDSHELTNCVYGLFDGYLYDSVPSLVADLKAKQKYIDKGFVNVDEMKEKIYSQ